MANHGIFQHTRLVRCVEQVLIDEVICLEFVIYGNAVLSAVRKQVFDKIGDPAPTLARLNSCP
eukprot:11481206-Ditylum_brightwellii.AAC.1